MKGGKQENSCTDSVLSPNPPVPSTSATSATADGGGDAAETAEEERRNDREESGKVEAAEEPREEKDGEAEDSGAEECDQLDNLQIVEAETEETEGDKAKLAEGYYEIETVRRKRVRKGQVQYLIKWRGWSEAANTWEPLDNLLQCSDIIDAYEESLKSGKSRSTRKRKRQSGITHVQTKKKQQFPKQKQSPAAATYNVPSHVVRIAEDPVPFPRLNGLSSMHDSGETDVSGGNSVEMSRRINENGVRTVSVAREEEKESNELNLKLCELKGAMVLSMEDANRTAVTPEECQPKGLALVNRLNKDDAVDLAYAGRCTGARKRKSGSVKRFKHDPASYPLDDSQNIVTCNAIEPVLVQHPDYMGNYTNFHNKYSDSKTMCTITQIVKPISYKASISNNVPEVLVAFEAVRSDGSKVTVDNKFLKANNPLLLIDFYEKHLRYSPT